MFLYIVFICCCVCSDSRLLTCSYCYCNTELSFHGVNRIASYLIYQFYDTGMYLWCMILLFLPLRQLIIQNDESLAVSRTGQHFSGLHLLSAPLLVLNQQPLAASCPCVCLISLALSASIWSCRYKPLQLTAHSFIFSPTWEKSLQPKSHKQNRSIRKYIGFRLLITSHFIVGQTNSPQAKQTAHYGRGWNWAAWLGKRSIKSHGMDRQLKKETTVS